MSDRPPISGEDVLTVKQVMLPDMRLEIHHAVNTAVAPLVKRIDRLEGRRWIVTAVWTGISAALTFVGLELKNK